MVKSTMTETCSAVLRSWQNCSLDGAERTDDGRAFHARAAVTRKARSPSVVRREVGMTSVDVETRRRRRREPTSAVKWRARYVGAVSIRQRYRCSMQYIAATRPGARVRIVSWAGQIKVTNRHATILTRVHCDALVITLI